MENSNIIHITEEQIDNIIHLDAYRVQFIKVITEDGEGIFDATFDETFE